LPLGPIGGEERGGRKKSQNLQYFSGQRMEKRNKKRTFTSVIFYTVKVRRIIICVLANLRRAGAVFGTQYD